MAKKKLTVDGLEIRLDKDDYVSLTDIAKRSSDREPSSLIQGWLRNQNTLLFLDTWEQLHNPNFKPSQMAGFRLSATENRNAISAQKYIKKTEAIGITSQSGRYGGTFAHSDIALNFCYWLSPSFQVYFIKEFQRLKADEAQRLDTDWNVKRLLSKANWHIHTEAVREYLVPMIDWNTKREAIYQASEADLLNLALFGLTAREWQQANPDKKGNIRDHASTEQLLVLANLQSLNAKLIEWDSPKEQRIEILHKTAREQMEILVRSRAIGDIKKLEDVGKRGNSPLKLK